MRPLVSRKETRFFRSHWAGGRCAATSRSPFFPAKRSRPPQAEKASYRPNRSGPLVWVLERAETGRIRQIRQKRAERAKAAAYRKIRATGRKNLSQGVEGRHTVQTVLSRKWGKRKNVPERIRTGHAVRHWRLFPGISACWLHPQTGMSASLASLSAQARPAEIFLSAARRHRPGGEGKFFPCPSIFHWNRFAC